jgi:hypothetical protein
MFLGEIAMLKSIFPILLLLACPLANLRGDELDEVVQFLKANVINRTVSSHSTGVMADGKISYDFQRDMTYCNLIQNGKGFSYDVIAVIKQRNWDLKNGERFGDPQCKDRIYVSRKICGKRESTGEILGYDHGLTGSIGGWSGGTSSYRFKLRGGKLLIEFETARYNDFFDAEGKYYPGSLVGHEEFSLQDGKLVLSNTTKQVYHIEPETGRKESVKESDDVLVDKESAKLPLE